MPIRNHDLNDECKCGHRRALHAYNHRTCFLYYCSCVAFTYYLLHEPPLDSELTEPIFKPRELKW